MVFKAAFYARKLILLFVNYGTAYKGIVTIYAVLFYLLHIVFYTLYAT